MLKIQKADAEAAIIKATKRKTTMGVCKSESEVFNQNMIQT